jgi:hypothetical protein
MISNRSYFCAFLSMLFIGCANKGKEHVKAEPSHSSVPQSLAQRLSEGGGYKQDAEGNWKPTSNKRSSFELQRESPHFKDKFEKETYKAGDYEKKSWWGKKTYEVSEYKGDTDGSRFQTQAELHGKETKYMDKRVSTGDPYKTNRLEYGSAGESDAKHIDKPRNDYVETRRRVYKQPSIIDWDEQRKLSLEESRGILGR